jgi:hypothetical protein
MILSVTALVASAAKALLAHIESLEKGDQVVIEWKHLYGELRTGGSSPVSPLLLLKKIDQAEAKKLRD